MESLLDQPTQSNLQLILASIFDDGCVLQQGSQTSIWGMSAPGALLNAQIQGKQANGTADAQGSWRLHLPMLQPGGPYTLSITVSAHDREGNVVSGSIDRHVWVGEVFLCAGQSNMELPMSWIRNDNLDCFDRPADPGLRQFKVDPHYDLQQPHANFPSGTTRWTGASPQTLGDFSALAYFFGQRLREQLGVPIGLLNVSLGGSPIASWLDLPSIRKFPSVLHELDGYLLPGEAQKKSEDSLEAIAKWYADLAKRKEEQQDVKPRRIVTMPDFLQNVGLSDFIGEVELTKHFTLTATQSRQVNEAAHTGKAARGALLRLGTMADRDQTWINGTFLGGHDNQYEVRDYEIPEGVLHVGENEICIHLVAEQGMGRLTPQKQLCLRLPSSTLNLDGEWSLKVLVTMDRRCPVEDFVRWLPIGLYNRMIAPIVGFAVRAVLWYQGESDTGPRADLYANLLRSLIHLWRQKWGRQLPFYIVQLPAFSIDMHGEDGGWPLVRQAEWDIAKGEPDVTTVVTLPDGEWNDLHPSGKEAIANRLALTVENSLYRTSPVRAKAADVRRLSAQDIPSDTGDDMTSGNKVAYQPVVDPVHCRMRSDSLILSFANHVFSSGHRRVDSPVRLTIANGTEDGGTEFMLWWHNGGQTPVYAKISGNTVRLPLRTGRLPDEVRYAWRNAPRHNLLAEKTSNNNQDVLVPPFRLRLADIARW